jgi:hypothetical protein
MLAGIEARVQVTQHALFASSFLGDVQVLSDADSSSDACCNMGKATSIARIETSILLGGRKRLVFNVGWISGSRDLQATALRFMGTSHCCLTTGPTILSSPGPEPSTELHMCTIDELMPGACCVASATGSDSVSVNGLVHCPRDYR